MVRLDGSIELAPLVGLAERIVDLVQSGETLRANGLVEVAEILQLHRAADRQPRRPEDRARRAVGRSARARASCAPESAGRVIRHAPDARTLSESTGWSARSTARHPPADPDTVARVAADRRRGPRGGATRPCSTSPSASTGSALRAEELAGLRGGVEAADRRCRPRSTPRSRTRRDRIEALPPPSRCRARGGCADEHGSLLGQEVRRSTGSAVYVPGGRAAYPSTVLMTAVPARVAGVREIVLVSPPGADGRAAGGGAGRRAHRRRDRGLPDGRRPGRGRARLRHRDHPARRQDRRARATSTSRSPSGSSSATSASTWSPGRARSSSSPTARRERDLRRRRPSGAGRARSRWRAPSA